MNSFWIEIIHENSWTYIDRSKVSSFEIHTTENEDILEMRLICEGVLYVGWTERHSNTQQFLREWMIYETGKLSRLILKSKSIVEENIKSEWFLEEKKLDQERQQEISESFKDL